jgi:predicted DsbA family dithiol-disulfide isomerase
MKRVNMKVAWMQGLIFLATGVLLGFVMAGARSAPASDPERTLDPSAILAVVGDSVITQADVEAARPAVLLQARQQLRDVTAQALDALIQEKLLRLGAEARGVEAEELLRTEIDSRVEDPSEERIAGFFEERRMQGSLERLAPQIREYLRQESRRALLDAFLADLESRYPVERRLEPLRINVASEGFPSKGPRNAPVTIVEFSDFQCPYCLVFQNTLQEVEEAYGDWVRFVYRQFPLSSIHPQAYDAALASLCADEQGKFWEMHDAMFTNQHALGREQLKSTARDLGLDGDEFDECLDLDEYAEEVEVDLQAGRSVGVQGTPATFINGRFVSGAKPFEEVAEIIDEEVGRAGRR